MSRLQSASDYQREIAALDRMLGEERALSADDRTFAGQFSLQQLEQRRDSLIRELHDLGDDGLTHHEIDVILTGQPVMGHAIQVEFLGVVLTKLQEFVRSLLTAEQRPDAQRRRFAADIRKISNLQLAGTFPGSFGMQLEAAQEQPELDGFTALAPTIRAMLSLIASADTPEEVLDRLAESGPLVTTSYKELLGVISAANADMRVVWPSVEARAEASVRASQAAQMVKTLEEVRETTSGQYYTGVLDITNRRNGRFGFTTEDGERFDGIVEPHVMDDLRRFYDRRCQAYILTREFHHLTTGARRKQHRLQELNAAPKR